MPGKCYSKLYIENLVERSKTEKLSDLALEAIRNGNIAPVGRVGENQKLTIALLDYFFRKWWVRSVTPGYFASCCTRGTARDKNRLLHLKQPASGNAEAQKTMKFFEFVHLALNGKKINRITKWKIPKDYRFLLSILRKFAESKNGPRSLHQNGQ
ncbi:MAG: hypothetical protein R3D86_13570 [Emcibacteraceae bacterium]